MDDFFYIFFYSRANAAFRMRHTVFFFGKMRFVLQKELPLHILSEDIRRSLFHNPKITKNGNIRKKNRI